MAIDTSVNYDPERTAQMGRRALRAMLPPGTIILDGDTARRLAGWLQMANKKAHEAAGWTPPPAKAVLRRMARQITKDQESVIAAIDEAENGRTVQDAHVLAICLAQVLDALSRRQPVGEEAWQEAIRLALPGTKAGEAQQHGD